jgi:hypothetical protein
MVWPPIDVCFWSASHIGYGMFSHWHTQWNACTIRHKTEYEEKQNYEIKQNTHNTPQKRLMIDTTHVLESQRKSTTASGVTWRSRYMKLCQNKHNCITPSSLSYENSYIFSYGIAEKKMSTSWYMLKVCVFLNVFNCCLTPCNLKINFKYQILKNWLNKTRYPNLQPTNTLLLKY